MSDIHTHAVRPRTLNHRQDLPANAHAYIPPQATSTHLVSPLHAGHSPLTPPLLVSSTSRYALPVYLNTAPRILQLTRQCSRPTLCSTQVHTTMHKSVKTAFCRTKSRPLDEKPPWKHPKSPIFLSAHLMVHFTVDSAVQRKQKSDHPKYFYCLCRAEIGTFTYKKRENMFCSDFDSEHANQPDDPKSEANLPSDQKVDFSRNWVSGVWVLPRRLLIRRP